MLSQRFGQRADPETRRPHSASTTWCWRSSSPAPCWTSRPASWASACRRTCIASLTAEDPAFHGQDGKFNRQQFDYVLGQIGMRPEDYFENRAQVAIRQQIVEAVADGIKAPDTFLRAVSLYNGEDRTAEYLALPRSLVEPVEAPADAVLSAWFEERKKQYSAPEYRKIAYVKLEPADIADESAITDEQVRADYDKNKARYTTPETRTIEQLVFPSKDAANAAVASLQSGTTFDKIVEAEGKKPADVQVGTLAKDRIPDKAVADAAFALGQRSGQRRGRRHVRPGPGARHRDQPEVVKLLRGGGPGNPQGSGAGRSPPRPARRP